MSKVPLQETGWDAARHYKKHERKVDDLAEAEEHLRFAGTPDWKQATTVDTQEESKRLRQSRVKGRERDYNEGIKRSAEFARDNTEQLHDLAVIEAHLAGVAINVEQPVEIGHKVEVRTPNRQ